MIKNLLISIGFILFISTCRLPSESIGEITILKRFDTINTGGNCMDLDIDIADSILIASANYNGFYIYQLYDSEGKLNPQEVFHGLDLDPNISNGQINKVIISETFEVMVLLDKYNKIYVNRLDGSPLFYIGSGVNDCLDGAWSNIAIDDQGSEMKIITLLNHLDVPPEEEDNLPQYSKSIGWQNIENFTLFPSEEDIGSIACEFSLNIHDEASEIHFINGLLIIGFGELGVKIFKQLNENTCFNRIESEITSKDFFINITSESVVTGFSWSGYSIDANISADTAGTLIILEIDGSPTVISNLVFLDTDNNQIDIKYDATNGEGTGNRIWIENENTNIYSVKFYSDVNITRFQFNMPNVSILSDQSKRYYPNNAFNDTGNYESDKNNCENGSLLGGYGGIYEPAGGISPNMIAEFDTPGEVEVIYSVDSTIFTGLSYSNGCMMTRLNNDGSISESYQFASGYTIKGIHSDNGLLALAAGHDGILLFNWDINDTIFIGKIRTSYANNVKLSDNVIYVATEDGIEIIQIDY